MRRQQKAKAQTITLLIAAVLSGMLVAVIARLLVGVLLAAVYAIVPRLLWSPRPPEGAVLAPSDITALMLMPVIWLGYLIWGGLAGALAWKYRADETARARKVAVLLCWGLLLINSGWLLWLVGVLVGLSGKYGPPPGNDWRYALLAFAGLSVEPIVAGFAILKMPKWLQYLHQPVHDFLNYGR
ncbi:MAG: hypothetical protein KatS3mg023_2493 [Armatimonadota bacterium]|nr:MAG: hypothetical protein KatS3mg023_2493 [Armatimonadota bacterium]